MIKLTIEYGCYDGDYLFKATNDKFKDLIDYADTWEDALSLMIDSVQTTLEILNEKRGQTTS